MAPRLGQGLHPGRQVHRIADDLELQAQVAADGAQDNRAGMNPDTHPDARPPGLFLDPVTELGHFLLDGQGRADSPMGGVFQGNGSPEKGHDAVSPELLDRPLILMDLLGQNIEDLIDEREGLLIPQPLGQARGVLQIAEHDRDLAALPFDPALLGQDFFG